MAAVMQNIKIAKGMKFVNPGIVNPSFEGEILSVRLVESSKVYYSDHPHSWDCEETLRDPEKRVLVKPDYDDADGWKAFVPAEALPGTGPKDFKVGEVYAFNDGYRHGVFLVQKLDSVGVGEALRLDVPAAQAGISFWTPAWDSHNSRYSTLIFTADEPVANQPKPLTNAEWLALPQTAALLGEIDARITPLRKAIRRRLDTIEKTIVPGAALSEVSLLDREKAALREWEDVRDLIGAIGR